MTQKEKELYQECRQMIYDAYKDKVCSPWEQYHLVYDEDGFDIFGTATPLSSGLNTDIYLCNTAPSEFKDFPWENFPKSLHKVILQRSCGNELVINHELGLNIIDCRCCSYQSDLKNLRDMKQVLELLKYGYEFYSFLSYIENFIPWAK